MRGAKEGAVFGTADALSQQRRHQVVFLQKTTATFAGPQTAAAVLVGQSGGAGRPPGQDNTATV